jgi:hypothetical protein
MGELDFAWDAAAACWRADVESPALTSRWGNPIIRRVEARRGPGT